MEIDVAFHKWHVVDGPVGGTVTSVDGSKTFCTIPEGGQGTFYATVTKVVTSDDSITIDEVENFNCAPVKLWLLGLGRGASTLPVGYLEAEFLETSGTQTLRVDTPVDNEFGLYFDVVATNATASNNFTLSMQTNDGGYKNIRINNYAMTWWTGGSVNVPGNPSVFDKRVLWQANYKNNRLLTTDSEFGHAEKAMSNIAQVSDMVGFGKGIYVAGGAFSYWMNMASYFKAYSIKLSRGSSVTNDLIPAVDKNGIPCMYDRVSKQPVYNSGGGQFIVGMGMKQARKLSKLPASGGELTVSLPWEAQLVQYNTEVEATLETARSNGWLLKVQYREAEPDGVIYNKYATCASVADLQAVNADYKQDLTADGEWLYPLEKLKTATSVFNGAKELKIWRMNLPAVTSIPDGFRESGLTEFNATISASNINAVLYGCNDLVQIELDAPNATAGINAFGKSPARQIKANLPKLKNGHLLCSGCSNLEDFDGTLPSVTDLTSAFSSSILNKDSVLRIIDSLQSFTDGAVYPLYLGIHVDHQTDAEVLAAIETAETKGWSVVVRWNGTPTAQAASTFGLRRPTIYAKVVELDGQRSLDWGHYVTKWEENGYLEFASVEEAREYFNIEETAL